MKYIIFLLFFTFWACEHSDSNDLGEKLGPEIDYWVPIGDPTTSEYQSTELPEEKRAWLVHTILEKAKNQELPVYYYLNDTLMPMDSAYLAYLFHHVDTEYIDDGEDLKPVAITETLAEESISRFKFREQWYFNEKTNVFTKKVIAVCPMRKKYKNMEEVLGYVGLFWVYLDY